MKYNNSKTINKIKKVPKDVSEYFYKTQITNFLDRINTYIKTHIDKTKNIDDIITEVKTALNNASNKIEQKKNLNDIFFKLCNEIVSYFKDENKIDNSFREHVDIYNTLLYKNVNTFIMDIVAFAQNYVDSSFMFSFTTGKTLYHL